jgi:hypothetical protein
MTLQELQAKWTDDCRVIVPDFELYDEDKMEDEILRIRNKNKTDRSVSDFQLVIQVIRALRDDQTQVPTAWWWIKASLTILDDMEAHPWFEMLWWLYIDMQGKREITTLWGSASVSKSAFFAAMVLTTLVVWHGVSHAYITCPYKNSGEDKIFENITKRVKLWQAKPPGWSDELGLTVRLVQGVVSVTNSDGLVSTCELVSLESTASVQGKKRSYLPGRLGGHERTGALILIGDELIINPAACREYLNGAGNLVANNNFMGWVGMNPLPHQVKHADCLQLSAPVDRSMDGMNEHTDFTWKTARGRLVRLCMANSPNRHRDKPVFAYLINKAQAEVAAKGGDHIYAAQVAAWGFGAGMGNGGVLSLDAVNTPEWQGGPVWLKPPVRWMFADIAFGGNDPAGFSAFEAATALVDGKERHLVSCLESDKIHVSRKWTPTQEDIDEFTRLARARGGKPPIDPPLRAGVEIGANALMCLQVLRCAARLGIPKGMVSFDSSMRPDVTQMMREALGHVPWYYHGKRPLREEETSWPLYPPERNPDGTQVGWSDKHMEVISAAWRFAEHLIAEGHVRGLAKVKRGTSELLSRLWVQRAATKTDVQGKKQLPASPMWGETLCLGLTFGVRFCDALPKLNDRAPISDSSVTPFEDDPIFEIRSRRVFRSWTR